MGYLREAEGKRALDETYACGHIIRLVLPLIITEEQICEISFLRPFSRIRNESFNIYNSKFNIYNSKIISF